MALGGAYEVDELGGSVRLGGDVGHAAPSKCAADAESADPRQYTTTAYLAEQGSACGRRMQR